MRLCVQWEHYSDVTERTVQYTSSLSAIVAAVVWIQVVVAGMEEELDVISVPVAVADGGSAVSSISSNAYDVPTNKLVLNKIRTHY